MNYFDAILNPIKVVAQQNKQPKIVPSSSLVKRLQTFIKTKIKHGFFGSTESIIKGTGLGFSGIKEYNIGDDVRKIDWNVFSRTNVLHIREYYDDRQKTFWFLIDISKSMNFGKDTTKLDKAREVVELFCLIAKQSDSRVGAFIFDGDMVSKIEPSSKHNQHHKIIYSLKNRPTHSGLQKMIAKYCCSGNILVCISDFIEFEHFTVLKYAKLQKKCKIISCVLYEEIEKSLPSNHGILNLSDCESNQIISIDTSNPIVLSKILNFIENYNRKIHDELTKIGQVFTVSSISDICKQLIRTISR